MTSAFRKLDNGFYAAPQIGPAEVADAAAMGVTTIVNNRPDGEDPLAPQGAMIAAAAKAMGLDYVAIPVTRAGFTASHVEQMQGVLASARGPVLGYCRAGTRSTMLWALAEAANGRDRDDLNERAAHAGHDLTPIAPLLDELAGAKPQGD